MPIRLRSRKLLLWGGVVLALVFGLAVLAYYQAPAILTIESGPCKAGAIVVLGGDPTGRPVRAAELFKEGAAPLIIVSGDGDNDEVVRALRAKQVPGEVLLQETKSGSTKQNAEFSVELLKGRGITNAIIVTSWFHSRRALNTFRKAAPDLTFYSRPSSYAIHREDWHLEGIASHIKAEYLKLAGYWVCYGVRPF